MIKQFQAKEIHFSDGKTVTDKVFTIVDGFVLIKQDDGLCEVVNARLVDRITGVVSIQSRQKVAYF